LIFNQNILSNF